MSGKQELAEKFDEYLDDLAEHAHRELVEGHTFTRSARRREIDQILGDMRTQRDIILDYAEEISKDDPDDKKYVEKFLSSNPFLKYFTGPKKIEEELKADLVEHFKKISNTVSRLLDSEAEDFASMVQTVFPNRIEAENKLEEIFDHSESIKDYGEYLDTSVGPFTVVNFSEDILPVIEESERMLDRNIRRDLDHVYEEK